MSVSIPSSENIQDDPHHSPPTCIDDSSEEIIEDVSEALSIEHPVQSSNKDSLQNISNLNKILILGLILYFLRVEPLTGTPDVVTVGQDPGDDLHLLAPHPPAGDQR